ncbi:adenylate/guanylate cyclase domain-containing protein [Hoeflea sp. TYP-13]|uniref:adenylate/guanylate cyclase domain-containing protein n=1 Tax=Hoeflea sp. TYP-13 TaxID=3230023 RepID=UPI0034C671E3
MDKAGKINDWLIGEGRLLGDGIAIVSGYARHLLAAGVPLSRARIAQRLANPLLAAWGVIWTPEETRDYKVPRTVLDTGSWHGSPFQRVLEDRSALRKRLTRLDPDKDHQTYLEIAEAGGTDFFAMVLEYGDGSAQGCSFVTNDPDGFEQIHLDTIADTRQALAAAMEPVAMRRSSESLLRTYLGNGPANAVIDGTILRGEHTDLDAVVMFSDLRDFTSKSERWSEAELLKALDGYFEIVVQAVFARDGDVLKFIGDGILSIFPVDDRNDHECRCLNAIAAARQVTSSLETLNDKRASEGAAALAIGTGINMGPVTYGNIGSPDRLDFTVIAPTVNLASRVQDLCKVLGEPVLATTAVADLAKDQFRSLGAHSVKGVSAPIEVFALHRREASKAPD